MNAGMVASSVVWIRSVLKTLQEASKIFVGVPRGRTYQDKFKEVGKTFLKYLEEDDVQCNCKNFYSEESIKQSMGISPR